MLAILLSALITGHVLTDNGSPVAGVAVSDGVTIAQTDASGAYQLPYRDNAEFVFVSVPSGYDMRYAGPCDAYDVGELGLGDVLCGQELLKSVVHYAVFNFATNVINLK